ncbi:MAG: hypothetical protein COT24_03515 [Candidatus Kerfeldbacteria bacterium CG08_land_8_20_14_0_20_40_16]|uniref:Uncharacterized protein n=1 Tax=Candidatus Kerfeldbacteria bacterium CG08_land_8_20_14_0_20_40_16 TaxID=2014244 RepID=A0A2H0YV99_9BACT|nr:MAG: hypothetical protein COT24_03515 [Candidatus Kerfeldbacteria bacterium CG08_land_8_20_14_0_20_40_16]
MPEFENINPERNPNEGKELLDAELEIERELIGRAGNTNKEKQAWIAKNAERFRIIVQEPDIIELIRTDRNKAVEEIERRLKEERKEK